MLISVIVPNYNGARFLAQAVDSVLEQVGVDFEVIVVDDGSTDDSESIIQSYGSRILSSFQENCGAAVARNAGLSMARGNYVCFLDSDDMLYPHALAHLYQKLCSLPAEVSAFGNASFFRDDPEAIYFQDTSHPLLRMNEVAAMIGQNILTGRVLHRIENVHKVSGFDASLPRGQEFDMHFRMSLEGIRFQYVDCNVLRYRVHNSSTRISGGGFSGNDSLYFLKLNDRHCRLLADKIGDEWPPEVAGRMARRLWEIGRGLLREDDTASAAKYFKEARALCRDHCCSGGALYRAFVVLFGPEVAEKLNLLSRHTRWVA